MNEDFEAPSSFSGSEEGIPSKFREIRDKLKKWIEEIFNENHN